MSLFCDITRLKLKGGNGGKGCVSFRREKFVPRGGPDGGDGGNGGSVFLKVNHALNSLIHLETYKQFQAEHGEMGMGSRCHGKNGKDLILEVPLGTLVKEINSKKILADLSQKDKVMKISKGGKGGYGNAHFVSSIRQAPKFAELGEDGEEVEVELELKLVADIGIIGIPSAGKSSLISVISNAKPKIAAYPFTTLIPHLGVVKMGEKNSYVVADIPGLIEGAHRGKGLGITFLKHIERCRILVHLIDPIQQPLKQDSESTPWEGSTFFSLEGALYNFKAIDRELKAFSKDLAKKLQIVVINKRDVISHEESKKLEKALKKELGKKTRFLFYPSPISCATKEGISDLKNFLFQKLQEFPKEVPEEVSSTEHRLYLPHLENPKYFSVEKLESGQFQVKGRRIEQIVNMTVTANLEALNRVYDVLKKTGIQKELRKLGAKDGDQIQIGKKKIEFSSL